MRKLKFSAGAKFSFAPGLVGEPNIVQMLAIAGKANGATLAGGQAVALWEYFLGLRSEKFGPTGFVAIDFIGPDKSPSEFVDVAIAPLTERCDGPGSEMRIVIDDEEFIVRFHNSMNGADLFGPNGLTSIDIDGAKVDIMDPLALLGQNVFSLAASASPLDRDLACALRLVRLVERFISNAAAKDLDHALKLTEWFFEGLELPDTRKTLIKFRLPILEAAPLSAIESYAQGGGSDLIRERVARLRSLYSEARKYFIDSASSHAE